jgi:hypothetical protein
MLSSSASAASSDGCSSRFDSNAKADEQVSNDSSSKFDGPWMYPNPLKFVASSLTSLTLHGIQLGFPGGWHCLTALTALQRLDLQQAPDPPLSIRYYEDMMASGDA